MYKIIKILLAYILSWAFFYPLFPKALPSSVNSKMLTAVIGIVFFAWDTMKHGNQLKIDRGLLILTSLACVFSISCYASVTINGTNDYAYTSYIVTMFVWLSAAFASMRSIKWAHGYTSVRLVATYIVMLCLGQCIMALLIEYIPTMHNICYTYFSIPEGATWESRLIGLGAAFDVAGIRFAVGLLLCAALIVNKSTSKAWITFYFICYIIIATVGNMLARTTTVGILISFVFLFIHSFTSSNAHKWNVISILSIGLGVSAVIFTVLYNNLAEFRDLVSFGFEGPVNYLETGEWKSTSNEQLKIMWSTWPDNMKTWIIGDGYFLNPDNPRLFYMGTDVGYARFAFYCGLFGFFWFLLFFIYLTWVYMNKFPQYKLMFFFFLVTLLGVWCKVSTDIFLAYAIFFFVDPDKDAITD